ncbi:MAG: GTP cyclohydrolase I FolE [Streptococcaceae bacterium]|nr:GTP cyclohydrolase I FolE [Streptococcaceae bacterium]MCL2680962.1 GTP cyclohydrolase I FolE [Streptococcaceae bacterium]
MKTVYLSLGSNIGDRQDYLNRAVNLLGESPAILIDKRSQCYQTSPVGEVEQDDFVNQVLRIATGLNPVELLKFIHSVEARLGRTREIHWGPRTIDIDILFYDKEEMNTDELIIPHKEVFHRLFVLVPLQEIMAEDFAYRSQVEQAVESLKDSQQMVEVIEAEDEPQHRIESAIRQILSAVGENPEREGLIETPTRVAKMYEEILSSQKSGPFDEYKLFKIEPSEQEQMVMVKDIDFYSMCEHHMLPFFGKVHVAYLPQEGNIIGLSKIPRLVNYVSRKLSVQENITREIAETLQEILNPKAVAVLIEARHMCVEMRGVRKSNSMTRTSFYLGEYETDESKRNEFLEGIK